MKLLLEYERLGRVSGLDADELAQKIELGLDKYTDVDANALVNAWCKKKFSDNWDKIRSMYLLIQAEVRENGLSSLSENTNLGKFLHNFNTVELSPSQSLILYNCLTSDPDDTQYLSADADFLNDTEAFRSDKMLKSCIFVANSENVNDYGLKNKNNGRSLTVDDVLNTASDKDLENLINSSTTKSPTDEKTLEYWILKQMPEEFPDSSDAGEILQDELEDYILDVTPKQIKKLVQSMLRLNPSDKDFKTKENFINSITNYLQSPQKKKKLSASDIDNLMYTYIDKYISGPQSTNR